MSYSYSCKLLWKRSDLPCRHYRGPGSSLLLFEDLLILTMDGVDVQYLVALDKETGRTVWKTDRTADWDDLNADGKPKDEGDLRKAYSTPLLVTVGGDTQMLSVGAKALYGYDPVSGRELWKVPTPAFSGAASPVYGHGIAYMITGFGRTELLADKPILTQGAFDSQNLAFWDTVRHEYRCYFRDSRDGRRDIKVSTSKDFLHWTEPEWLEFPDAPKEHLYTNAVMPYYRAPHLFIGFPTRYLPDRGSLTEGLS